MNHPLYGERRFKSNHYIYSVFIRSDKEWWMYARHEQEGEVYYLGKILDNKRIEPLNNNRWDYTVIKDADRLYYEVFKDYLKYNRLEKLVNEMDKRTYLCNNGQMPVKEKKDRNRRIIELAEKGKSYAEIGALLGIKSKGTIYKIVHRDMLKYAKKAFIPKGKKFSPVSIGKSLATVRPK